MVNETPPVFIGEEGVFKSIKGVTAALKERLRGSGTAEGAIDIGVSSLPVVTMGVCVEVTIGT